MSLALYATLAFTIPNTDDNRAPSKYYRQENNPPLRKVIGNQGTAIARQGPMAQKTSKPGGPCATVPPPHTHTHLITPADIWHAPNPLTLALSQNTKRREVASSTTVASLSSNAPDLISYLIANQNENEVRINTALSIFSDAMHMLLRNQVEKREV